MSFIENQLISQLAQTKHYVLNDLNTNIIPTSGQVCVFKIPSNCTDLRIPKIYQELNQEMYLIKIGNGQSTLSALPWINDLNIALSNKTFILDCNIENS
jgi:hypothetical protein